jgi:arylsulfatase A-like enzyme
MAGTVPAGRTSTHPWAHWDMLPTFVDLAGGKVPGDIDGMSMARALRGESQPRTRISTGSSTSGAFNRPCAWGAGRRCD